MCLKTPESQVADDVPDNKIWPLIIFKRDVLINPNTSFHSCTSLEFPSCACKVSGCEVTWFTWFRSYGGHTHTHVDTLVQMSPISI